MNGTVDGDPGAGGESRRSPLDPPRRRVLASVGGLLAAGLAGCTGSDDAGDGEGTTPTRTDGTGETTPGDGGTGDDGTTGERTTDPGTTSGDSLDGGVVAATGPTDDLDLREANVTGVEFDPSERSYRVSVTLYHDDDGEEGYANWWQVEDLAGERLGRRELLHAHGTREFTRSATVEVPSGISTVVVRGHDRTHGYGGQAAVVDLAAGGGDFVRQGPDPVDFPERGGAGLASRIRGPARPGAGLPARRDSSR